jgi:hypothetical protein
VYPKLVKIYSRLTHEFNRIFGGMGFALSFNYELPMLTDTRKLQAEALKTMLDAGFTHESAVEALRLPESFRGLKLQGGAQERSAGAQKSEDALVPKGRNDRRHQGADECKAQKGAE